MTDEAPEPQDVLWLTYDELGARLGIAAGSALRRAMRGRWARRRDPDGHARCAVPRAILEEAAVEEEGVSSDVIASLAYLHQRVEAWERAHNAGPSRAAIERDRANAECARLRDALTWERSGLVHVLKVIEIQAAARPVDAVRTEQEA